MPTNEEEHGTKDLQKNDTVDLEGKGSMCALLMDRMESSETGGQTQGTIPQPSVQRLQYRTSVLCSIDLSPSAWRGEAQRKNLRRDGTSVPIAPCPSLCVRLRTYGTGPANLKPHMVRCSQIRFLNAAIIRTWTPCLSQCVRHLTLGASSRRSLPSLALVLIESSLVQRIV